LWPKESNYKPCPHNQGVKKSKGEIIDQEILDQNQVAPDIKPFFSLYLIVKDQVMRIFEKM